MTLSIYIEKLQDLLKTYGDVDLIYSTDDEGNDFRKVSCSPEAGNYSKDGDAQFIPKDQFNYYDDEDDDEELLKVNSVCVN